MFTSVMCRFWVANCISRQSCHLIPGNSYPAKFHFLVCCKICLLFHSNFGVSVLLLTILMLQKRFCWNQMWFCSVLCLRFSIFFLVLFVYLCILSRSICFVLNFSHISAKVVITLMWMLLVFPSRISSSCLREFRFCDTSSIERDLETFSMSNMYLLLVLSSRLTVCSNFSWQLLLVMSSRLLWWKFHVQLFLIREY